MSEPNVIHSTFVIERSYPHPPERVFNAFSDPRQKRRWFAEGASHETREFTMDFRAGGSETLSYVFKEGTPFPGVLVTNVGRYEDIVPNQRVITASVMTLGGRHVSVSLVTLEFLPTAAGTDLICTHQGAFFEGSGGPQIREAGWRSLFEKLAAALADAQS